MNKLTEKQKREIRKLKIENKMILTQIRRIEKRNARIEKILKKNPFNFKEIIKFNKIYDN